MDQKNFYSDTFGKQGHFKESYTKEILRPTQIIFQGRSFSPHYCVETDPIKLGSFFFLPLKIRLNESRERKSLFPKFESKQKRNVHV